MSDAVWHDVIAVGAFPEEGKLAIAAGGWHVLLVREGDGYFAFNDVCPHQAARLSPGRVRRGAIMCPLHGARFRIENGECIGGAYQPLRQFPLRIEGDTIMVELPDRAPGPGEGPMG